MKRRDLLNTIGQQAKAADVSFGLKREGAGHSIYAVAGKSIAVPRHNEITEGTARGILRQAANAINEAVATKETDDDDE